MAKLAEILHIHSDAPVERILGQAAQVLGRTHVSVSNHVHAEWINVSFPKDAWPEEHARLNLFPVADGQFCLQLLYLQFLDDEDGNARICWMEYRPAFFEQYPLEMIIAERPFRFDQVTEQQFNICAQSASLLQQLEQTQAPTPFILALHQSEVALHLLRRALECITMPFTVCAVPACRFLAVESERDKILDARRIIEENMDKTMTIKELSRKVAMNECYLKKGFKALVGKTIHEYQQDLRIAKAKDMLRNHGLSVSHVASTLGYSSISHFSTAFKKATGMKPCELLS